MGLGCVLVQGDRLYLPNGQPIPNDGSGRGLKHGIDTWFAVQSPVTPAPKHQVSFTREAPPHFPTNHANRTPSAHIEEITETHIVQVIDSEEDPEPDEEHPFDFFQVFATEKKKRETRRSKLPELQPSTLPPANATPPAPAPTPPSASAVPPPAAVPAIPSASTATDATASQQARTAPQYRYQSTAEDLRLISELESWLMEGKLTQTTPAHILAASPTIRKDLVEKLRVRRVETSSYEEATDATVAVAANQHAEPSSLLAAPARDCRRYRPRIEDFPSGDIEVSVQDPANPSQQVIRGVHLIPNFPRGRTDSRLPPGPSIARPADVCDEDWDNFYVNL